MVKVGKARKDVKKASAKDLAFKTRQYKAFVKAAENKKRHVSLLWTSVRANE